MEQLFRTTELEVRLSLNMNVLDAAGVPRVMSLAEVLEAYLAHRMEVLVRRSQAPAGQGRWTGSRCWRATSRRSSTSTR